MNSIYVAKRLLKQISKDKRLLIMMFVAPTLVLLLLKVILQSSAMEPTIALVSAPEAFTKSIEQEAHVVVAQQVEDAEQMLKDKKVDAYISFLDNQPHLMLEGSDPTKSKLVMQKLQNILFATAVSQASPEMQSNLSLLESSSVLYGSKDYELFEGIAPLLMGFLIFFYVFVTAGISFLRERTTGTLDRLLATPLKRWEIVLGYFLGFGSFVFIQTVIIQAFGIYALDIPLAGSFWLVTIVDLLLATVALSMALLLSAYARNEFQMFQFIPIVIVPQVLFSGMFDLSGAPQALQILSKCFPVTYAADALREVMIRGAGFSSIVLPLIVMIVFSVVFLVLNSLVLKKYRKS